MVRRLTIQRSPPRRERVTSLARVDPILNCRARRLASKYADQFFDDALSFSGILRHHRLLDAMRHVLTQEIGLNARQCSAYRLDLRDNVDAIAVLFDHLPNAAHLPLNTLEGCDGFLRNCVIHDTPMGLLTDTLPGYI